MFYYFVLFIVIDIPQIVTAQVQDIGHSGTMIFLLVDPHKDGKKIPVNPKSDCNRTDIMSGRSPSAE